MKKLTKILLMASILASSPLVLAKQQTYQLSIENKTRTTTILLSSTPKYFVNWQEKNPNEVLSVKGYGDEGHFKLSFERKDCKATKTIKLTDQHFTLCKIDFSLNTVN